MLGFFSRPSDELNLTVVRVEKRTRKVSRSLPVFGGGESWDVPGFLYIRWMASDPTVINY